MVSTIPNRTVIRLSTSKTSETPMVVFAAHAVPSTRRTALQTRTAAVDGLLARSYAFYKTGTFLSWSPETRTTFTDVA